MSLLKVGKEFFKEELKPLEFVRNLPTSAGKFGSVNRLTSSTNWIKDYSKKQGLATELLGSDLRTASEKNKATGAVLTNIPFTKNIIVGGQAYGRLAQGAKTREDLLKDRKPKEISEEYWKRMKFI